MPKPILKPFIDDAGHIKYPRVMLEKDTIFDASVLLSPNEFNRFN